MVVVSGVATAAELVVFPIVAAVTGAGAATWRLPGPKVTSAVQHFAAGVVFAAVAGEVLLDLRDQHSLGPLVAGFVGGVATLLLVDAFERRAEKANPRGLPTALLAAIAIDLAIDGVLVGIGAVLGEGKAAILTIALTLEVLFLGLSLAIELRQRGLSAARATLQRPPCQPRSQSAPSAAPPRSEERPTPCLQQCSRSERQRCSTS